MAFTLTALLLLGTLWPRPGTAQPFAVENFMNLSGWQEVRFPKIDTPSSYAFARGRRALRMSSAGGASMLVLERSFATGETPVVQWEWTVTRQVSGADYSSRDGDDAAARIYVAFRRPLEDRSTVQRVWARTQRRLYGQVPPDSAISYIWAESGDPGATIRSPYTEANAVVFVDVGRADLGSWQRHRRNVAEDYRSIFGADPPGEFFIAVMSDSDNTDTGSEAFLRSLSVSAE